MRGYTDKPVETVQGDTFGVNAYINGLSKFILSCDTPMTISVQGDWGSGKTSMMNMIKDKIDNQVLTIWFNTWQFSQFGMNRDLTIWMMSTLLKELSYNKDKLESITKALTGFTKTAAFVATEMVFGSHLTSKAANTVESLSFNDAAETIKHLKGKYQEAVKQKLAATGKERLVVFVDDLDRLQPETAVELLESLKVFLDCEKCIYVLAVDYEVVAQGIRKKFGDSVDIKKGKSFFDKIIQLPFKMPVEQYNIQNYISDMFDKIDIKYSETDLDMYENLIKYSIGCNPRSMKRLFNSFLLLNNIAAEPAANFKDKNDPVVTRGFFAILCMQMAHEVFYNFIVSNKELIEPEFLNDLTEYEKIVSNDDFAELTEICPKTDLKTGAFFLKKFLNSIMENTKDGISEADINRLKTLLFFANMTSVSAQPVQAATESDIEWNFRYRNKDTVKLINQYIKKEYKKDFKSWMPRKTHANGTRISDCWGNIWCTPNSDITFSFDYGVRRDIKDDSTFLTVLIQRREKTSQPAFEEYFGENPLEMTVIKNSAGNYEYPDISKSFKTTASELSADFIPHIDKMVKKMISFM